MRFVCETCVGEPCELRVPGNDDPASPHRCPFVADDPCWREVPSRRSTLDRPGLDLVPGPFCEVPATAIVRAVAEGGRYWLEIGGLDRLLIPCSRAAFEDAVRAMEAVSRAAMV
jgi:hypothetical protein